MTDTDAPSNPEFRDVFRLLQENKGRFKERSRVLFQNRPQSWRHLLSLLCGFHFAILIGRLTGDLLMWGLRFTKLNVLSTIAAVIAFTTRITWHALFVNPHSFAGYRRPSRAYRLAVLLVTFATTVPALIIHIALIRITAKARARSEFNINFGQSILQLVLLIAAITLYGWMAHRFLLQHNDEHYEPTTPLRLLVEDESRPSPSSIAHSSPSGHLSRAYARQKTRSRRTNDHSLGSTVTAEPVPASGINTTNMLNISASNTSPSTQLDLPGSLRCQTIARFDYMPRSWHFDRLIPLVLVFYGTWIAYLVCLLIRENGLSKLPSPKAKGGLHAPIGVYLLCIFATSRITRLSLFAKAHVAPPEPWVRVEPQFGKPKFRNTETDFTTTDDPGLRVSPINCKDYITKYNNTRTDCNKHWGHLGREWVTDFRSGPAVSRFTLLGLAFFEFAKGFLCIFNYPIHADDYDNRPDLTPSDLLRQMRIMSLKLRLMIFTAPLAILVLLYTIACAFKVFGLWSDAIIRYAPAENAGSRGRIRL